MCFINHGCPGCDNVYIDIDCESIRGRSGRIGQGGTDYIEYTFQVPVVKAKSDLIKGDVLRLDYGVKFGASTEEELQALGFRTVRCNCPLHSLRIITTDWYLPDASKGLKKKRNPINRKQMDEWKRQSQRVYDSMCSTAADNALAFKRIQPP